MDARADEIAAAFMNPPINDRREQVGWYFYDWANAAFSCTVVTVFMGPYLTTISKAAADPAGFVHPLGIKVAAGSVFPYAVSVSVALQALLLPLLGAIGDYTHLKKHMFGFFAYLGAIACLGLYFLEGTRYMLGSGLFIIANVAYGAAVVFYNAFLPDIATPDRRDHVSCIGWGIGYIGGGLLLALNLVLFSQASSFGLTTGQAVRISLMSAGVWWGIFTLLPLKRIRKRASVKPMPPGEGFLTVGFHQLKRTLSSARKYPQTLLFLIAFLIYHDGVQSVITLSAQFGQEELGLSIDTLTKVILMAQFVGFVGNVIFNWLASKVGAKHAIALALVIWGGVVCYAYGFMHTGFQFVILGGVIAIVMGGTSALSRSLFSQMVPNGQESEYFGLYEISDRGTSWLGPLAFGLALQFTGSYRVAILSLILFFVVGFVLLCLVNVHKAATEARHEAPSLE